MGRKYLTACGSVAVVLFLFWLALETNLSYGQSPTITPTPLVVVSQFSAGDILVVSDEVSYLLLYAEPSDDAQVLEALLSGTEVVIVDGPEFVEQVSWWKVRSPSGAEGWIPGEIDQQPTLNARTTSVVVTPIPPSQPSVSNSATFEVGDSAVIMAEDSVLMLFSEASEDSDIVEALLNGVVVTIRDNASEVDGTIWWPITSPSGMMGWVPEKLNGQQVLFSPGVAPSTAGISAIAPLDSGTSLRPGAEALLHLENNVLLLHSEPNGDSDVIEALIGGITVSILEGPETLDGVNWWKVRSPSGLEGWIPETVGGKTVLFPPGTVFATPTPARTLTPLPSPTPAGLHIGGMATIHTTEGDTLNVRSGPNISNRRLTTLPNGSVVEIIGGPQQGGAYTWWKIRTAAGVEGWVVDSADGIRTLMPGTQSVSDTSQSDQPTCNGVPARFQVGETVVVSELGDALRLMTDYRLGARGAIDQLNWGDQARIERPPACEHSTLYSQEVWYWYVYSPRHNAYGWVQDGLQFERWLCPLSNPTCDRN
jgi:uncharacterized protein YgiM (DUF1202 family)